MVNGDVQIGGGAVLRWLDGLKVVACQVEVLLEWLHEGESSKLWLGEGLGCCLVVQWQGKLVVMRVLISLMVRRRIL